MLPESQHDYHTRRAREELDLAYRAEARRIMEVHLRLSALHMAELTRLARHADFGGGTLGQLCSAGYSMAQVQAA